MIAVACWKCQKKYNLQPEAAGRTAKCSCGSTFIVPSGRISNEDLGSHAPRAKPSAVAVPPPPPAEEALPELTVDTEALPELPVKSNLLTTAAVLSFVWGGLMVLIAMFQIGNGTAGLGMWNLLASGLYVAIGIGILQRKRKAYQWGIGSNVLNAVFGLVQIVSEHVPIMGLFLILEGLIVAFLVIERRHFPNKAGAALPPTGGQSPRQTMDRLALRVVGGAVAVLVGGIGIALFTSQSATRKDGPGPSRLTNFGVPYITVSGPFADKVSFTNWRWEGAQLVGEMTFTGENTIGFGGCRYRVLRDGIVQDSGILDNPDGRIGEALRVSILYPHSNRANLSVELITQFGGRLSPGL